MGKIVHQLLHWHSDFFTNRPALGFGWRMALVFFFLMLAVWGNSYASLAAGFLGCLVFRYLCCKSFWGMGIELRGSVMFTLILVLLAAPTHGGSLARFAFISFMRIFLFVSPSATFSRCLYPREGVYSLQAWLPASLILAVEIALRFMPLLVYEAFEVFSLQSKRGSFSKGPVRLRIEAFILPFFVRLFRISDRVAFALHSRGIDATKPRVVASPQQVFAAIEKLEAEQLPDNDCNHSNHCPETAN